MNSVSLSGWYLSELPGRDTENTINHLQQRVALSERWKKINKTVSRLRAEVSGKITTFTNVI